MNEFLGIKISLNPWSVLPLIILATAAVAYLINIIVLKVLKRTVPGVAVRIDDPIYRLFERYLFPLLIVVELLLIEDLAPLPPKILRATHGLLVAFAVLLVVLLSTKAVLLFLRNIESRYEPMGLVKGPIEIAIKIIFVALGGMIILDNLGVSITPLITTLGIGSLAVAIALQDTLGNFFTDNFLIKHEFIKKLHSRYRQEGIAIPFPIHTVHLQCESDDGNHGEKSIILSSLNNHH